MLHNDLILWYLFLGGLGGGTYLSALAVRYIPAFHKIDPTPQHRKTWMPALIVSAAALIIGAVCLLKDLTNSENALLLFTKPTFSAITVGTYALALFILLIFILLALEVSQGLKPKSKAVYAAEILAGAVAFIVIIYTGMLLNGVSAVPLWDSPLLPVLFLFSSLSVGIATVLILSFFSFEKEGLTLGSYSALLKTDSILLAVEALVVVLFIFQIRDNPAATASLESLFVGQLALQFWAGFVTCAFILPLGIEVLIALRRITSPRALPAIGITALVGGFFLRFCIIQAGIHLSRYLFT